jgi:hypothetical protein
MSSGRRSSSDSEGAKRLTGVSEVVDDMIDDQLGNLVPVRWTTQRVI